MINVAEIAAGSSMRTWTGSETALRTTRYNDAVMMRVANTSARSKQGIMWRCCSVTTDGEGIITYRLYIGCKMQKS